MRSDRRRDEEVSILLVVWRLTLNLPFCSLPRHKGYLGMMRILPACDEDAYINSFTFDTLQNLMDYIKSEGRMELLRYNDCLSYNKAVVFNTLYLFRELEPMLSATCEADLSQERVINNAFSELFVHTGSAAHMRPPPIWKSVILTIVSLMTIIWLAGNGINVVFAKEGLDAWTSLFLNCVLTVGLNTWIGLPSMQYLFGEWLRLPVPPQGSFGCTACKFLDDGFSLPIQCIVFVIYCALNILSGYLGF